MEDEAAAAPAPSSAASTAAPAVFAAAVVNEVVAGAPAAAFAPAAVRVRRPGGGRPRLARRTRLCADGDRGLGLAAIAGAAAILALTRRRRRGRAGAAGGPILRADSARRTITVWLNISTGGESALTHSLSSVALHSDRIELVAWRRRWASAARRCTGPRHAVRGSDCDWQPNTSHRHPPQVVT